MDDLRVMCVLAHPDDESLATGGLLARCAAEGVSTYVVTATRGERGRYYDGAPPPGPDVVGCTRERELAQATATLGVRETTVLGYPDGALDQADHGEATAAIAAHIRRVRPHVVVTFGPEGAYGHTDHIAISQLTVAAVVSAADAHRGGGHAAHSVSKLYFIAWSAEKWAAYQAALKTLVFRVDGQERQATPWPSWAITTVVDTSAVWATAWKAVSCHRTQMSIYARLADLPEVHHRALWGTQEFYRVFSCVNGGRARETDLLEGLR